jgi:hypothetical protein
VKSVIGNARTTLLTRAGVTSSRTEIVGIILVVTSLQPRLPWSVDWGVSFTRGEQVCQGRTGLDSVGELSCVGTAEVRMVMGSCPCTLLELKKMAMKAIRASLMKKEGIISSNSSSF